MAYPPYDYFALRDLPDSLLAGYRTGDGLYQSVVDDWKLVLGVDVEPAREDVIERPKDSAKRTDWVDYVSTQDTGKSREELDELSRDELIALVTKPAAKKVASTTTKSTDTGA
jgi:hypothetical protein